MKTRFPGLIVTLVLLFVLQPPTLACGPFTMEAIFVFTVHPSYPLDKFAAGDIGVVQPGYARSYLYVAYRYLENAPFSPGEQKALVELWKERLGSGSDLGDEAWIKSWRDARQRIANLPEPPNISVYRNREKPNEYEAFVNCTKDSFDTAVTTLNERIKRYGPESSDVRTWVGAQDQVFANCSAGKTIPEALPQSADPLAQADRNYQIAAATFYSTDFVGARKALEDIGADAKSPWQLLAPYLTVRALVRQASLGAADQKTALLTEAETRLKKILSDKQQASTHNAAARLMDLVRFRLHPAERLHELAHTLENKNQNPQIKQNLWDYTLLLDGVLEADDTAKTEGNLRSDDLSDWISTLQTTSNEALEHAVTQWQTTKSSAWLVATLTKIDGKNRLANDLLSEALKIKASSPAFASSRFHAVRIMVETGKTNEARTLLDQLLKSHQNEFDASTQNLLISERMMLATDLADFLNHAPRIPAALSWNDDGREIPAEPDEVSDEEKPNLGKPLFDEETANVINKQLPLSLLKEAVLSESLPRNLRMDLAQAVWIRAILLDDYKTAEELAPTLRVLVPALSKQLDEFSKTTLSADKKFVGLYTWLNFPGIEPIVDIGIGRSRPLNQQDTYRDNWWCGSSFTTPTAPLVESETGITSFTSSTIPSPLFLTANEKAEGSRQWAMLSRLGAMPNYLSKQVIQFGTKNPTNPRVPESLHLAVTSTRFGCTDKETGRWSKAAFDLLHRKYPNTTWAKKTRYWFKE